jgi:hypothetical protein
VVFLILVLVVHHLLLIMEEGDANVCVRLDRAVATVEWRDMFNDVKVRHIASSCSDDCPVYVELRKKCLEQQWADNF